MKLFRFESNKLCNYRGDYEGICSRLNELIESKKIDKAIAVMGEAGRRDLFFFCYFLLDLPINHPWLVMRVREIEIRNNRTVDLWAREHWKSTLMTYGLNLQEIVNDVEVTIGIFSHTRGLAKSHLRKIKHGAETNERLKLVYPEVFWSDPERESPKWSEDDGLIFKRKGVYLESTVEAWGLTDGMPTGKHFKILDYDDVVTEKSVTTVEQLAKGKECFGLSSNLGKEGGKQRVKGTRYHFNDLFADLVMKSGWLVREHPAEVGGEPVLFSKESIEQRRVDNGPYQYSCHAAGTLVLMGDWTLRPIEKIEIGDIVIGVEKPEKRKKTFLRKTKVLAINQRISEINEYELESGNKVCCTPDHKWWMGRWSYQDNRNPYLPLGFGKFNAKSLVKIIDIPREPSEEESKQAYYLGGIFDGEGSAKGDALTITQSKEHNPEVCDRLVKYLNYLGFRYGSHDRMSRVGHKGATIWWINGGRSEKFRFMQWCNPAKRGDIVRLIEAKGTRLNAKSSDKRDKLVAVKSLGEGFVYNIQTETGNYIANGYVSANCQYLLNPVADELQEFKPAWVKYWSRLPKVNKYILVDPASRKGKKNDYTTMVVIGVDAFRNYYLIDMVRKRLNLKERWSEFRDLVLAHPTVLKIGYERSGMQADNEYFEEKKKSEGINFRVEDIVNSITKEIRIRQLIPPFSDGKFYLPHAIMQDGENLVQTFLNEEFFMFPYAPHDDILDVLSMIFDEKIKAKGPVSIPVDKYGDKPRAKPRSWRSV
jgi:predicted phage terminase large subunit-like protein